ncbi:MAG: DUF2577 domain-containing protein [Eubacteriales bacterium]|nr:DUF2577 domain-containing protein [Eubacteriales bacterium]MDD4390324.1 DUF2577 domain-containing protein [Eubacteriales bacterium]
MDSIVEMANLLKERNNPSMQGIGIGKVIAASPLKIAFNSFVLEKDRLVIAKHLLAIYGTSDASITTHGSHAHTVSDKLKSGEKVIVIPSTDNMTYYVIDKVGDL